MFCRGVLLTKWLTTTPPATLDRIPRPLPTASLQPIPPPSLSHPLACVPAEEDKEEEEAKRYTNPAEARRTPIPRPRVFPPIPHTLSPPGTLSPATQPTIQPSVRCCCASRTPPFVQPRPSHTERPLEDRRPGLELLPTASSSPPHQTLEQHASSFSLAPAPPSTSSAFVDPSLSLPFRPDF